MNPVLPVGETAPPQIWQSNRTELVRFVAGRVNDATLADDIVHDVLLRALSQIGTLENPAKLRAWLFRITRHAIIDHYRARRPSWRAAWRPCSAPFPRPTAKR